ncbi:MAG: beta-lactamase family protein [Gemmatimonadetes bacterium]|nr:beta-lactamase family protein [Gemmatimonadota bacterium]MBM4191360.1 beta-lactamase family protein [Gemmatimonadota bacterium]
MTLLRPLLLLAASAALLGAQTPAAPSWAPALDSITRAALTRTGTPGVQVAVVLDGRLVYERATGLADAESQRPATTRTLFRIGSVTKMLTAATLMELAASGKLDPQAPIGRYVTEVASRRVGTVTTHQLLTHTAGWIDNAVAYGRMGEGALGEVFREVGDTLFFTDPGQVISYSNPGFSMAGYVAERAGEARFATVAERLVLRPVGMTRSTFRPLEVMTTDFSQGHMGPPGGAATVVRPYTENTAQWAAGFLFSTAGELARFATALMQQGELDGKRVLAASTVQRLTTGYQPIPGDSVARYGYGLMIGRKDGQLVWEHGGAINGFDAIVTMWPERRAALIVIDNRSGSPLPEIDRFVREQVFGLPARPTPTPATPRLGTAEEQRTLVGTYAMGATRVSIAAGADTLRFTQGPVTLPLLLLGADKIRVMPPMGDPIDLLLVRDRGGKVTYLHQGLRALARQP